jgi:translocation and assembly module TamB
LTTVDLSLTARDGLWSVAPRLVGRSIGEVSGAMQLRTAPQDRWPDADAALSGAVQARVPNLGVWSGWVPPGWRLQGEVVSTASLGGRFGAPQLTGELVAQRVSVRNLLQGVDYTDGELKVALQGDTARIERLSLRSGEGRITGEGVGEFGARPSARVQVRAESFRVLGRFDRQLVASGQAVLALQPEALKLDGRVVIDSGLFDLASRDAPTLDDDVTVLSGRDQRTTTVAAEPAALPRLIRQSSVNLDVDLGKKLRLRGRGLDTALQGELKLTTPSGSLAVNGSVRAQGGTYAAYGQKLTIERGIVSFSGRVDSPRLDILALRPNTDIRVGVAISGSPQSPRVRLVSEPEMSETEKLSWLLLGRGSEGLGRTDTAVLQRAAVALLAGEGEAPTDSLLRALGIDDLSVGQVSGQTSGQASGDGRETVIRLGKQLSRNWYAGYERGVNATAGTFQLIYRVAQRFTLRAQSGLENSVDLIWTWRYEQTPLAGSKRVPP